MNIIHTIFLIETLPFSPFPPLPPAVRRFPALLDSHLQLPFAFGGIGELFSQRVQGVLHPTELRVFGCQLLRGGGVSLRYDCCELVELRGQCSYLFVLGFKLDSLTVDR